MIGDRGDVGLQEAVYENEARLFVLTQPSLFFPIGLYNASHDEEPPNYHPGLFG